MNTVLAHGCFDLLHLGHIKHLQEARKLGDRLVVSITDDDHVNKGVGRPVFNAQQRAEVLLALSCVDDVVINAAPDAVDAISRVKPSVYVKGVDYVGRGADPALLRERAAVEAVGGRLVFTETEKFSSSRLINSEKFTPEVLEYLERMRPHRDSILRAFDKADNLKIAFIGERIIDHYHYVRGLGRASKELMLATVHVSDEKFEGGVVAASKHGDWKDAEVVSVSKHITKTRLVDADFNRKLFDIYSEQRLSIEEPMRRSFKRALDLALDQCDVAIVYDFGHGLLDDGDREALSVDASVFRAVNAQTNAGNYGFNTVTKYRCASLVCVDLPEARLATGMDEAEPEKVAAGLADRIYGDLFIVTHGRHGSYHLDAALGEFAHAPAFITGGLDTMGAGDATLAVVAPLLAAGLPLEAAAMVGNVTGAIKTSIVGHRRHVNRNEIVKTIEALLA